MISVGICTRNNAAGLVGTLTSLIACISRRMGPPAVGSPVPPIPLRLFIADGSNRPVMTDPYVSRILAGLSVSYQHTLDPGLIFQRIMLLNMIPEDAPVLVLDDDHVYLEDPTDAFREFNDTQEGTIFGSSVDRFNDRGFDDYRFWSTNPMDDHGVGPFLPAPAYGYSIQVATKTANAGHMLTTPGRALPLYQKVSTFALHCAPAVQGAADDAVALRLAQKSKGKVASCMRALHIGNSNNWWGGDFSNKGRTVSRFLEALQ